MDSTRSRGSSIGKILAKLRWKTPTQQECDFDVLLDRIASLGYFRPKANNFAALMLEYGDAVRAVGTRSQFGLDEEQVGMIARGYTHGFREVIFGVVPQVLSRPSAEKTIPPEVLKCVTEIGKRHGLAARELCDEYQFRAGRELNQQVAA